MVKENLVSYFLALAYNYIDDLAETIMNTANCCSSTVNLSNKDNLTLLNLNRTRLHRYYQTKFRRRFLCAITNFLALPIRYRLPLI